MNETSDLREQPIGRYTCYAPPAHPGRRQAGRDRLAGAPKSPRFVDMASGTPGLYDTRMAALWDETYLYVGFWVEEPFVEAHHTERDAIIFQENDVEVFIDGGDCYYELEINALGTLYEVMFVWRDAYKRGSRFDVPEFDLYERQVYSFGGDYDRRPTRSGGARIPVGRAGRFWIGISPVCRWRRT